MKKLTLLLFMAFIIISACMIYLVKSGVSLRSAPIIRPSEISADRANIAHALVYRLSPEFQNAHYVLWGILPLTRDSQGVLEQTRVEYEKVFQKTVQLIDNAESASLEELKACANPCWLLVSKEKANELTVQDFLTQKIQPLNQPYFNLTWFSFTSEEPVPEYCVQEKRLTLECLRVLGIREFQRKMKAGHQYFFLKKYNERDFFLFFQTEPQA